MPVRSRLVVPLGPRLFWLLCSLSLSLSLSLSPPLLFAKAHTASNCVVESQHGTGSDSGSGSGSGLGSAGEPCVTHDWLDELLNTLLPEPEPEPESGLELELTSGPSRGVNLSPGSVPECGSGCVSLSNPRTLDALGGQLEAAIDQQLRALEGEGAGEGERQVGAPCSTPLEWNPHAVPLAELVQQQQAPQQEELLAQVCRQGLHSGLTFKHAAPVQSQRPSQSDEMSCPSSSDPRESAFQPVRLLDGVHTVTLEQATTGVLSSLSPSWSALPSGSSSGFGSGSGSRPLVSVEVWENACVSWRGGQATLELDTHRYDNKHNSPVNVIFPACDCSGSGSASATRSTAPLPACCLCLSAASPSGSGAGSASGSSPCPSGPPVPHMFSSASVSGRPLVTGTTFWWPDHSLAFNLSVTDNGPYGEHGHRIRFPHYQEYAYHALHDHLLQTMAATHTHTNIHKPSNKNSDKDQNKLDVDYWLIGSGSLPGSGVWSVHGPPPPVAVFPPAPSIPVSQRVGFQGEPAQHGRFMQQVADWYDLLQRAWLQGGRTTNNPKPKLLVHPHAAPTSNSSSLPGYAHVPSVCFSRLLLPRVSRRTAMWPFGLSPGSVPEPDLGKAFMSDTGLAELENHTPPQTQPHQALGLNLQHIAILRKNMAQLLGLPRPTVARTAQARMVKQACEDSQQQRSDQSESDSSSSSCASVDPLSMLVYDASDSPSHRWLNGHDLPPYIAPHHHVTHIHNTSQIHIQSFVRLLWSSDLLFVAHGWPQLLGALFLPKHAQLVQMQAYLNSIHTTQGGLLSLLSPDCSSCSGGWCGVVSVLSVKCGVGRVCLGGPVWEPRDEENTLCHYEHMFTLLNKLAHIKLDLEQ